MSQLFHFCGVPFWVFFSFFSLSFFSFHFIFLIHFGAVRYNLLHLPRFTHTATETDLTSLPSNKYALNKSILTGCCEKGSEKQSIYTQSHISTSARYIKCILYIFVYTYVSLMIYVYDSLNSFADICFGCHCCESGWGRFNFLWLIIGI